MFNIFSKDSRLKYNTAKHLEKYSTPSLDFFVLIFLSAGLATTGLVLNSSAIIIGAMVVAPLVTPVFSFSLNLILFDLKKIIYAVLLILSGSLLAVIISFLLSHLIMFLEGREIIFTLEILKRTKPNLIYFLMAIFSGMAGAYAYARPDLSERIIGIAISAAIIPPLSVIGISLAILKFDLFQSSLVLFLLNILGICFGSIFMFIVLGFGKNEAELKK